LVAAKERLMRKSEIGFFSLFGACALIISIAMIVVGAIHAVPLQRPKQESGNHRFDSLNVGKSAGYHLKTVYLV